MSIGGSFSSAGDPKTPNYSTSGCCNYFAGADCTIVQAGNAWIANRIAYCGATCLTNFNTWKNTGTQGDTHTWN